MELLKSTLHLIAGKSLSHVDWLFIIISNERGKPSNYCCFLFFFVSTRDNDSHENSRRSRLKRYRGYRGLPPLTPNACVKDTVRSLVFDHIWSEVISVLQPLCAAISERASQGVYMHVLIDLCKIRRTVFCLFF